MRDHAEHARQSSWGESSGGEKSAPAPGRTTLAASQGDEGAPRPSLFEGAVWESIDPAAEEEHGDSDQEDISADEGVDAEAVERGELGDEAEAPGRGDDEDGPKTDEPVEAEDHPGGVGALYSLGITPRSEEPQGDSMTDETADGTAPTAYAARRRRLPPTWATQDELNRPELESTPARRDDPRRFNRPGVRFSSGYDILFPRTDTNRYLIRASGPVSQYDKVSQRTGVAFNPVPPKKLYRRRGGRARLFALAFVKGKGSAWIPLSKFFRGAAEEIRGQSMQPAAHQGSTVRRVFRNTKNDGLSRRMARRYILPRKSGPENILDHYRFRSSTGLYNVLVNLPQPASRGQAEAPPIAADSALPNDSFFIARGARFRRLVATFAEGASRPTSRNHFVTFVYGYLAKYINNEFVPDRDRRGWVLVNVLRKP